MLAGGLWKGGELMFCMRLWELRMEIEALDLSRLKKRRACHQCLASKGTDTIPTRDLGMHNLFIDRFSCLSFIEFNRN